MQFYLCGILLDVNHLRHGSDDCARIRCIQDKIIQAHNGLPLNVLNEAQDNVAQIYVSLRDIVEPVVSQGAILESPSKIIQAPVDMGLIPDF